MIIICHLRLVSEYNDSNMVRLVQGRLLKVACQMRLRLSMAWPKTILEWLVIAVIIAILVALVVPDVEWASSGTIVVPVHVVVFDGKTMLPLADAVVGIVWAPPASGDSTLDKYREPFSSAWIAMARGEFGSRTGADGSVTIEFEFPTGASHVNPESRAHTRWYWLLVSSKENGAAVVPLRYESISTKSLREQRMLQAYVGLLDRRPETE
jgi:hypothetical protein